MLVPSLIAKVLDMPVVFVTAGAALAISTALLLKV